MHTHMHTETFLKNTFTLALVLASSRGGDEEWSLGQKWRSLEYLSWKAGEGTAVET